MKSRILWRIGRLCPKHKRDTEASYLFQAEDVFKPYYDFQ